MGHSRLQKASSVVMLIGAIMLFFPLIGAVLAESGLRGPIGGSLYFLAGFSLVIIFAGLALWALEEIEQPSDKQDY